jgi:hypothetical protein
MIWNRPKVGLWGLILLALFTTTNLYFSVLHIGGGRLMAIGFSVVALSLWFFALPLVFTMIDLNMNPKRIEKIWARMLKQ